MLPLRFVRLRKATCAVGFSVGDCDPSRGFVLFRVFSIPGGVTSRQSSGQLGGGDRVISPGLQGQVVSTMRAPAVEPQS
jgi:hypothetical protein